MDTLRCMVVVLYTWYVEALRASYGDPLSIIVDDIHASLLQLHAVSHYDI